MNIVLKIVAILCVVDSIVLFTKPTLLKAYSEYLLGGKRIYLAAAINAAFGIILLFGVNSSCNIPAVIIAIGTLSMAGAIAIIASPEKARAVLKWAGTKNQMLIRIFAIFYLLFAALLVYSV